MLTLLLLLLLLVIALAVVATVHLKRAGEREWTRHLTRSVVVTLVANIEPFVITLRGLGDAATNAERAADRFREAMRRANLAVLPPGMHLEFDTRRLLDRETTDRDG